MPSLLRDRLARIFFSRKIPGRLARPPESRLWPLHLDYARPHRRFYGKTRKRLPVAPSQTIPGLVIALPAVFS
jgi:hypothetical protein